MSHKHHNNNPFKNSDIDENIEIKDGEKTEEKVVSYYEEEQQKPQFTRFTIRYNQELLLNPHIQELAPIRLKNEGEADE